MASPLDATRDDDQRHAVAHRAPVAASTWASRRSRSARRTGIEPTAPKPSSAIGCVEAEPGSPWENGYTESFNSKLRDELLNGELFYTLREAQILIAGWRRLYNGLRPHSSLGQRPPAPETIIWPGFSLADYGPPSLTPEVTLALT
jgi:transposase InsO family protein